ncbi:MAG: hypothetical protein E7056_02620 [Lentisphaerae bacterium]|nr:hypothetical protein [Lentisphaerota bacterium]
MISVTNFREGAVLNARHGIETAESLTVRIEGLNSFGTPAKVNGIAARQDGLHFAADVPLTAKINTVEVSTMTCYGEFAQKLTLVWDKKSFRRCRFYIDDNIFVFTELAKQRPQRAFDHFYLKFLKEMHRRYGLKVTLNTFLHNDHEEFLLKDMPDIWKDEFSDNADWLKITLHSYSEFPDRPYADASRQQFLNDYYQLKNEVERFAGSASHIVPAVLHWANLSPGVAEELIKLGCNCYCESMRTRVMSTPPAGELTEAEKMNEFRSEIYVSPNPAMARHFGFAEEIDYLGKHFCSYDRELGIFFYHDWIICNLLTLEQIPRLFKQAQATADQYKADVFSAGAHEQYSFPAYFNYQPDHFQKLETALRLMVEEANCKCVFFQDGLLGNTAWDE